MLFWTYDSNLMFWARFGPGLVFSIRPSDKILKSGKTESGFRHSLVKLLGKQRWPTQIGLWVAFVKNCSKYWLFGPHFDQNWEKNTQNIEKSLDFKTSLGRRNIFFGRGLVTPALESTAVFKYFFLWHFSSENLY
jgi:hypothetical protein